MSRIPAVDAANASNASKPLLDAVQKSLGVTPNLFKVTAQSSETLEGLLGLNGALAKGRLSAAEREAIALAVAEINGCDYCLSAHTVLGGGAGLSEKDIFAARRGAARRPVPGLPPSLHSRGPWSSNVDTRATPTSPLFVQRVLPTPKSSKSSATACSTS